MQDSTNSFFLNVKRIGVQRQICNNLLRDCNKDYFSTMFLSHLKLSGSITSKIYFIHILLDLVLFVHFG